MTAAELRLRERSRGSFSLALVLRGRNIAAAAPCGVVELAGSTLCHRLAAEPPAPAWAIDFQGSPPRFAPNGEEAFVEGLQALALGSEERARELLAGAARPPAAHFLDAALALRSGDLARAESALEGARRAASRIGRGFWRHGLAATIWLALPGALVGRVEPERGGLLLVLAEVCRASGRLDAAQTLYARLARLLPGDVGVSLLYADLLLGMRPLEAGAARSVVALSEGATFGSDASALLLLFRARALRALGRAGAARELCARGVGRSNGSHDTLGLAFRLECAAASGDLRDYARAERERQELALCAPRFAAEAERSGVELAVP